jgi:DNA-binding CsgD family transcriptional regulator
VTGQWDEINALRAQGRSVREIAEAMGLSRSMVHRRLQASPSPASDLGEVDEPFDDGPLTDDELAHIGVARAKFEAGLMTELDEYRLQEVASYRVRGVAVPSRARSAGTTVTQRDDKILELRADGLSLQAIADALAELPPVVSRAGTPLPRMTKAGVGKALVRLLNAYDDTDLDEYDDGGRSTPPRLQAGGVGKRRADWRRK